MLLYECLENLKKITKTITYWNRKPISINELNLIILKVLQKIKPIYLKERPGIIIICLQK